MTPNAYYQPTSVDEALELIAEHGSSMLIMSGGTLAMPLINEGLSTPDQVLSLRQAGLNKIVENETGVALGAAVSMSQVALWGKIPLLNEAANQIGGWAIRNMATVGGNLFAPPPSGDFAVALLALDAHLKIVGPTGERLLPLVEFYTGFMSASIDPDELVTEIQVPWPIGKTAYTKFGRKEANTPAIVTVAVHVVETEGIVSHACIALNGVGDHPFRAPDAEARLVGEKLKSPAIEEAAAAVEPYCAPFTDSVATDWYRQKMVPVQTRRTLLALLD